MTADSTISRLCTALLAGLCVACAQAPVQPGADRAAVLQTMGQPTARYTLPAGERLEYATGPFGRETWMVDLGADGRVRAATQVLNEASFEAFGLRAPGLSRADVLRELGRPGERRSGGLAGGEVWSWRYPTFDCLWFQVSIGKDQRATSASYGVDPMCDVNRD